jgi:putative spermidine/putrescine transport system substrate-binding protein
MSVTSPRVVRAPAVHAQGRPVLRVLGTEITLLEPLRLQAEADLGISIQFESLDFLSSQQKAAMHPEDYDVYDQCFHSLDIVWFWRAVQSIDTQRIRLWGEVNDLTKTGRISPDAPIGAGDAPVNKLYVQPDQSLGSLQSRHISMLPVVHNTTALPSTAEDPSWAWMFDARWHGGVAVVNEPAIGIFDVALAAQASGKLRIHDIGNMSVAEIDRLVDMLIDLKRKGHFCGLWRTAAESAQLMHSGAVKLQSIWSPALTSLAANAVPVVELSPREGYRAWHGGMCLSSRLSGRMLDVAYEYMNWWLSGWPGALMARQGYYLSVPKRVREKLRPAEWDYWYEGKPAACDLHGPDGRVVVRAGQLRSGGSYWRRASHIAVWNTTMDEHNYLVRRWADFVAA